MKKRIIAFMLAVFMMLSMHSTSEMTSAGETELDSEVQTRTFASEFEPGLMSDLSEAPTAELTQKPTEAPAAELT